MLSRRTYFFLPYVCLVLAVANDSARAEDAGGSGGAPQGSATGNANGQDAKASTPAADPNAPTAEEQQNVEQEYETLIPSIDEALDNTDSDDTLAGFEKQLTELKEALEREARGKTGAELDAINQKTTEINRRLEQVLAAREKILARSVSSHTPSGSDPPSGLDTAGGALGTETPAVGTGSASRPIVPSEIPPPPRPNTVSPPTDVVEQPSIPSPSAHFTPPGITATYNSPQGFSPGPITTTSPSTPSSNGSVTVFTDPGEFFPKVSGGSPRPGNSQTTASPNQSSPIPRMENLPTPDSAGGFETNVIRPGNTNRPVNDSFVGATPSDSAPEATVFRGISDERTTTLRDPPTFSAIAQDPPDRGGASPSKREASASSPPIAGDSATAPFVGDWFKGLPPTSSGGDDSSEDSDTFETASAEKPGPRNQAEDLVYAPPDDVPPPPARSSKREVSATDRKPSSAPALPVFPGGDVTAFTIEVRQGLDAAQ